METLMKADIFFFVTTIVVVILGFFWLIVALRVLRLLGAVHKIVESIEVHAGEITEEAKELLQDIKESFIFRLLFPRSRSNKARNKK